MHLGLLILLSLLPLNFAYAKNLTSMLLAESQTNRTKRLMAITGDEEYGDDQAVWDKTYTRTEYIFGKTPADFLVKSLHWLPKKGAALDIATGEGRNAVFLAKNGYQVEGIDISRVGLEKAQKLAAENKVKLQAVQADLNHYKIKPNYYSVILNFYYLQRNLFAEIKNGLKPGGVIIFEGNTTEQLKNAVANSWQKEYLLEPGELKRVFSDFEILYYSESNDGKNAIASLVARKHPTPAQQ